MHAHKTRIIHLTIHAVLCTVSCWSKSLWICMQVQYWHACNPITSHTNMWTWCKHILCVHYNLLTPFVVTTHNANSQKGGVNRHDILHWSGLRIHVFEVVKWSEVNNGFISQCERKQNYFVRGLIRLQVQQAYACTCHWAVTDQHIFARNI